MIDNVEQLQRLHRLFEMLNFQKIYMIASHGLLSGEAINRIRDSAFEKVVVTNTITFQNKYLIVEILIYWMFFGYVQKLY